MGSEVAEVEVEAQAQDLGENENEKSWAALVSLDEEDPEDPEDDPEFQIEVASAEKRGLKRLHGQFNGHHRSHDGQGPGDFERETDPATLARRTKQIQYGKISTEYQNYIKLISKDNRDDVHPRTPNIKRKYSRRAFDGLVRQWRLNLHAFSQVDPLADFYAGGRRTPSSSVSAVSTTTNDTGESTSDDEDDQDHDHDNNANDNNENEDDKNEKDSNNKPSVEDLSLTASPSTQNPKSRRRLI